MILILMLTARASSGEDGPRAAVAAPAPASSAHAGPTLVADKRGQH